MNAFRPTPARICVVSVAAALATFALCRQSDFQWVRIFDGKSFKGWTPKIKGYALRENFGDTFRIEDGAIKVVYDQYAGKFDSRFGLLYYEAPFSRYRMRLEYRFTGDQLPDGPGWAYRNSGVMVHSQAPSSIGKNQDFPVSIEVQLLGGNGKDERHTGNMCSPGTNVVMNGKLITQHCVDSTSKTFHGDQWVKLEIEVNGSGKITHWINSEKVMEYEQPQLDPNDALGKPLIKNEEKLLASGYIALQAESHPVEFRNIEIAKLP